MLNIQYSYIICGLVDQLLDKSHESKQHLGKGQIKQPGLLFSIDISISDFSGDENRQAFSRVNLIVTGTSVFVTSMKPSDSYARYQNVPLDKWENTSNHDSCWRSDGVERPLTKAYFESCDEVNKEKAPRDLNLHAVPALGSPIFKNIMVTREKDETDDNNYRQKLVSIEEV